MAKQILLASFTIKDKLDELILRIENHFNIKRNEIFIYNIDNTDSYLLTYKSKGILSNNSKFIGSTQIHKRGEAFYTINALNRLIEEKCGNSLGNIDYKSIVVDWNEYQNKMIIIKNNKLIIYNLKKIIS